MALPNLTTETMVMISGPWLDPKKQRKALTALPLVAPLIPVIQRAHDALLAKQKTASAIDLEIAAVQQEEAERDQRHDRKIRGTHGVLTGFAELSDDPKLTRALLDLRDRLLPIGITAMTRSYLDEAGDAQRLPSRLDDASRKLLAKLPAADGSLKAHVDAWLDEAKALGLLEERRDQLAQQLAAGEGGPSAAEVVAARHAWIRIARAVEANLALDPDADEETIEKILGPLRRAEAKADRRRGGTATGSPEEEDTADATPAAPAVKPEAAKPDPASKLQAPGPNDAGDDR